MSTWRGRLTRFLRGSLPEAAARRRSGVRGFAAVTRGPAGAHRDGEGSVRLRGTAARLTAVWESAFPGAARGRTARAWLTAFLAFAAADSMLAAAGPDSAASAARWATKPLLMPLLAGYVVAASGRVRGLVLPLTALAAGFAGDVGLLPEHEALFMAGMAGFAVGHVAYIRAFAARGAAARIASSPGIPIGYGLAWAAMTAVLWRGLDDLLVPVLGYSLLLTAMAVFAAGVDRRTAAGGALFLLSDALIACGIADIEVFPGQDALVMPTYLAAQYLLTTPWSVPGPVNSGSGRSAAAAGRETAAEPGSAAADAV